MLPCSANSKRADLASWACPWSFKSSFWNLKVNNIFTDERDRPSLKVKKVVQIIPSTSESSPSTCSSKFQSAQTARATVLCTECQKPRLIFSNKKLTLQQELRLAKTLSHYNFTCGSHLLPPDSPQYMLLLSTKGNINCAHPIEVAFYGADMGRKDLCCLCASPEGVTDPLLKEHFKTVLPIRDACRSEGKSTVTLRPFGKTNKNKIIVVSK